MFDPERVKRIPVTKILEPAAPGIHKLLGKNEVEHYVHAEDYEKLLELYRKYLWADMKRATDLLDTSKRVP